MTKELFSIREITEPIIGGFWGQTAEQDQSGNARVVRNGDILESGYINLKAPERILSEKELVKSKLKKGDILITMSGNVGRVARVKEEKDASGKPFAASNFVKIIRTNKNIDSDFLYFYLKSKDFQLKINKHTRGVAIQNLSTKVFDEKLIPKLSFAEQKKVAEILNKTEELRNKRKEANQKMEDLISALFVKMFGDPILNTMKWEKVPLSNLGTLDRGKSQHRPRTAPELFGGIYPFVQTGDISNAGWRLSQYNQTYSEKGLAQSKLWPKETLCITIAANIAKTTIINFEGCFPDSVVGFTANKEYSNVDYVQALFIFLQKGLEEMAPQAAQQNINLAILRSLLVPKPPIELQNKFADLVKEIEKQKVKQLQSTQMIDELFNSVMAKTFA
jgi:type I restriction enzyme S subunit